MRTPKVHSEAGELFWMGVWGSSSAHLRYPTQEKVADRKDSRQRVSDPAELRARLRQPFAGSPGTAGANLRKTVRYARENCDPLQRRSPAVCNSSNKMGGEGEMR